jgi:hypothetical protein
MFYCRATGRDMTLQQLSDVLDAIDLEIHVERTTHGWSRPTLTERGRDLLSELRLRVDRELPHRRDQRPVEALR